MGIYLKRLSLAGYRSYDNDFEKNTIDFQKLNNIIGANGAGKSNLISFLEMISYMMTRGLRSYVSRQGGGNSLMYFGPKNTDQIRGDLLLQDLTGGKTDQCDNRALLGDSCRPLREKVRCGRLFVLYLEPGDGA